MMALFYVAAGMAVSTARFVLVRTSHPGNIGSAARAIRTMGFTDLRLVQPQRYPDPAVATMAVGAPGVLENIRVSDALDVALSGCRQVFGLSARRRGISLPVLDPHAAAHQAQEAQARGEAVAFVFGNEASGLDNMELMHCHAMVQIPSVSDFSSLNLAQAVQVMAYEMRMCQSRPVAAKPVALSRDDMPAGAADMEQFFIHLAQTLDVIEFHKGRSPHKVMLRLRRLFQRSRPDARELRILHGILAEAERMGRRARAHESHTPTP